MKKIFLISVILLTVNALSAQWTKDPAQNTLFATGTTDYNEIQICTHEQSGNSFIQWIGSFTNGWSPSIQKIDSLGNPQWGPEGVHISAIDFDSYSSGVAMTALADGGVVSCFANIDGQCVVVKIDDDGNFAWGEKGIVALDGISCFRAQLVPCHQEGFWVMAYDEHALRLRYYHSDGTPGGKQITLSESDSVNVVFGQMVLDDDDNVFAVYQKSKHDVSYYYNKGLYVAKYSTDGEQLSQEEQLMQTVSISGEIIHGVCSDGMGGGYAWISHPALNSFFEVYLFHFDSDGHSTIPDPTGLLVSKPDGENFHLLPAATLHPTSHDLLITYEETDAISQSGNALRVNRIKADGTKVLGENGIEIVPMTEEDIASMVLNAYPDGTGASLAYKFNDYTVKALGLDANGTVTWNTTLAKPTTNAFIVMCDVASGYHNGQNIYAWQAVRNDTLGLYGQNLHQNGTLGPNLGETSVEDVENVEWSIRQSGGIVYLEGADIQRVELMNMAGQQVKVVTNSNSLAIGDLPQGIYVVRVLTHDGKTMNKKMMVRKW